jgi:hypothetical protein
LSEKKKQNQAFENFTKLHFSGAKNEKETRERRNRDETETRGESNEKATKECRESVAF